MHKYNFEIHQVQDRNILQKYKTEWQYVQYVQYVR